MKPALIIAAAVLALQACTMHVSVERLAPKSDAPGDAPRLILTPSTVRDYCHEMQWKGFAIVCSSMPHFQWSDGMYHGPSLDIAHPCLEYGERHRLCIGRDQ